MPCMTNPQQVDIISLLCELRQRHSTIVSIYTQMLDSPVEAECPNTTPSILRPVSQSANEDKGCGGSDSFCTFSLP